MFYLTTHSTHFIYGYMASDVWLRTILLVGKETRCRHILTARVLLYAPSHRQDSTYHGLCYTSRGLEREIAQWVHPTKDRSDDPSQHERMLLPRSYISLLPLLWSFQSFLHKETCIRNKYISFGSINTRMRKVNTRLYEREDVVSPLNSAPQNKH